MKPAWAAAALLLCVATAEAAPPDPAAFAQLRWRELGPFRGGWATTVTGVSDKPDVFYFGAAGGGVWKTDDAGRTWQPLFQHGPAASIGALAIAPTDSNVIYIGTGQPEPRYDVAAGLGVFKSTDGGAHWTSLGLENTRYIGRIWIDPKNADIVLVGAQGHFFGPSSDRGLYRSTDGGKTWTKVLKTDDWTGVIDIASDPANPKIVFASTWEARRYPWLSYFVPINGPGSAVYKSTDGGATWTKLAGGGWPAGPLGRIGLAATHTAKGTRVYATVDSKTAGGLWRSDDGGAHWSRVNDIASIAGMYTSRIEVAPDNPDIVYTVGQSIRRCTDGGRTCEIFKGAPGGDDYHQVWIDPRHPDHMITGSDQGAVVSVNGGATWSSWYNQPTAQFYHLAADNRFPYWIYSGQQDSGTVAIASRGDYGAVTYREWHPTGGEERDYDVPDPDDANIVYDSGLGGRVTRYDARTGQVTDVSPFHERNYGQRPTLTHERFMWMTPLIGASGPGGGFALYLGGASLYRSTDRGATWSTLGGDLTGKIADAKNCGGDVAPAQAKDCGYGVISAIAVSPGDPSEIWVGTDDGLVQLTRDGGRHWTDVSPKGLPLWSKIASIDVPGNRAGVATIAVDGHRIDDFQPHVMLTTSYGQTWKEADSGLPRDHFVDVVKADHTRPGAVLYAGTDAGVYVSFDDGTQWQSLQQNMPTVWVTDLLLHNSDLIAGTEGRGIWVLDNGAGALGNVADRPDRAALNIAATGPVYRVHSNNNQDTPLPPEEPIAQNPPEGAILDYWIPQGTTGPVTLRILDSDRRVVRTFSSADGPEHLEAERYFAKGWLAEPQVFSGAPGAHRFVWNLRYPRPQALRYGYGMGAIWGRGTPVTPQGPLVLPGHYQAVLEAAGHVETAEFNVVEDPRVTASPQDLAQSLALSMKIAAALPDAVKGYREQEAMKKVLAARFPASDAKVDPAQRALIDTLTAKPAPGAPTFDGAAGMLTATEDQLEAADAAPTVSQQRFVDDALGKLDAARKAWDATKAGPLAELNAALGRAGAKPVVISEPAMRRIEAPDEGEDLP
ncbi:MAG TPA: sialidase family protein [Rhizomicrobium sp.]|nr:sialidase family protein [Rhizomicrobium sp.]